ncbi:MAG: nucleotide exchange factor GrpE, partial [Planctomycetota bacterium]
QTDQDAQPLDESPAESVDAGSHSVEAGSQSVDDVMSEQAADPPETRDEEMARLHHEVEEANKRVLQAQADAENFRKRLRRDYEDQLKYASMSLVGDILSVRDNLLRAIEAAQQSETPEGLVDGVAMCAKQLDDTLGKYGVKAIAAEGEEFNPDVHEAIAQTPSDAEAGQVAHVAVVGFQMHDRVIRPSQVIVSTGPVAETE